jgi:glyoxylate carboligase
MDVCAADLCGLDRTVRYASATVLGGDEYLGIGVKSRDEVLTIAQGPVGGQWQHKA